MKFTVDVELLEAERTRLKSELARVELLLEAVSRVGVPAPKAAAETSTQGADAAQTNRAVVRSIDRKSGYVQGARKRVVMVLNTGPAREEEIAHVLGWRVVDTRQVLGPMLKYKICFLNETGHIQLSTQGKAMANWFIKNPERVMYHPSKG